MTDAPLDRRKKYTRMVVKDSLIQLLKTKSIASITVKEICELADINRSTYYSHYADQYDLLNSIEEEIMSDLSDYLKRFMYEKEEDTLSLLEKLLEYFASKHDICSTLLGDQMDSSFERKVLAAGHQYFRASWETLAHLDDSLLDYYSTYIISGCIHVMKAWLARGMDTSPREAAEMLFRLIHHGMSPAPAP